MLVDYIRQINAQKSFKLGPKFEFVKFDDITSELLNETSPTPDTIEIWAAVKASYDGTIPPSNKILNLMIGDWVTINEKALTEVLHKELAKHLPKTYTDADVSDVLNTDDTSIWLDQLDYMPRVNEKEKNMIIEIDLVLHADPIGEDE